MANSRNYKRVGEYKSWTDLISELDPGDLLEIQRGPIQHWGVFVENIDGKGIIVHVNGDVLTGLGAIVGKRTLADIRVEDLGDIVGDCEVRYNNSTDELYEPFPEGATVVKRGLSKLGQHDYDVFNFNCEHWANWCRNGNTVSMQADEAEAKLEEVKNEPKSKLEALKGDLAELKSDIKEKVDELKKGPPPPEKIEIPADAMEKLPFLKKFQDMKVHD